MRPAVGSNGVRPASGPPSQKAQRESARVKANECRARIAELKSEVRSGRLDLGALLVDPRAKEIAVLRLMPMTPGCTQRTALQALLNCQINGADNCGELSELDRVRLVESFGRLRGRHGTRTAYRRRLEKTSGGGDLDHVIEATEKVVPVVEHRPSEFAAARIGLEADAQLMRMVDRLVAALGFYEDRDDGGAVAHRALDQWLRFRNYRTEVAKGELPPPSIDTLPEVE